MWQERANIFDRFGLHHSITSKRNQTRNQNTLLTSSQSKKLHLFFWTTTLSKATTRFFHWRVHTFFLWLFDSLSVCYISSLFAFSLLFLTPITPYWMDYYDDYYLNLLSILKIFNSKDTNLGVAKVLKMVFLYNKNWVGVKEWRWKFTVNCRKLVIIYLKSDKIFVWVWWVCLCGRWVRKWE